MKSGNLLSNRFWTGIPPWVLIGAVLVLLPIFSFMTIENINRQKENSERLLKEKAAALIRSFEAGTRTGMAGRWEGFQLQKLLMETAQQPDIVHLIVTDVSGVIMASSDPEQIGNTHGKDLDLEAIARTPESFWRILPEHRGKTTFEFYRQICPDPPAAGLSSESRKRGFRAARCRLSFRLRQKARAFPGLFLSAWTWIPLKRPGMPMPCIR